MTGERKQRHFVLPTGTEELSVSAIKPDTQHKYLFLDGARLQAVMGYVCWLDQASGGIVVDSPYIDIPYPSGEIISFMRDDQIPFADRWDLKINPGLIRVAPELIGTNLSAITETELHKIAPGSYTVKYTYDMIELIVAELTWPIALAIINQYAIAMPLKATPADQFRGYVVAPGEIGYQLDPWSSKELESYVKRNLFSSDELS